MRWAPVWGGVPPMGLEPFGLIVVDASGWRDLSGSTPSRATIAGLRRHGLVLAHLSVGTVDERRPYARRLPPDWLLGPVPGRAGQRYVNVRARGWTSTVLAEAARVVDDGCDGLCVAGLDVAPALADGGRPTIRLVTALRTALSDVVLVALDGLAIAERLPIDAIACEHVFLRADGSGRPTPPRERGARVDRLRRFHDRGDPVFTLDLAPPGSRAAAEAVRRSWAEGFRPAVSVPSLDRPPHAYAPASKEPM